MFSLITLRCLIRAGAFSHSSGSLQTGGLQRSGSRHNQADVVKHRAAKCAFCSKSFS